VEKWRKKKKNLMEEVAKSVLYLELINEIILFKPIKEAQSIKRLKLSGPMGKLVPPCKRRWT
jgi:hypothetical protein